MKKFLQKILTHRVQAAVILLAVVFVVLLFPQVASAGVKEWVLQGLGWITSQIVNLLGKLTLVVIRILVSLAQYNNFSNSPVVTKGWMLIRDICNMMFVVMLLIMAFGTVLQSEQYSYKRMLGTLVFAAVLVNFSKGICGIMIDFSQVIMLTFVNAIKGAAEGNFAQLIGLDKFLENALSQGEGMGGQSGFEILITYMLAIILSVIALVVFTVVTIIILLRIVQLWFLVMLSPIAFVATVIPRTNEYASKWWNKFTNQVVVGPALAIFLWLSLTVVSGAMGDQNASLAGKFGVNDPEEGKSGNFQGGGLGAGMAEIGKSANLLGYMIGIAMLVASLAMAQEMGVSGASIAGNAVSKMKNIASGAAKLPGRIAVKAGKSAGQSVIERTEATLGIPLQPKHWKQAWEDRKRTVRAQRASQMLRTARARGIPTATEMVNAVTAVKGYKKMGQRIFGVDRRLRAQESEKEAQINKTKKRLGNKLTDSERASQTTSLQNRETFLQNAASNFRNQALAEKDAAKQALLTAQADDIEKNQIPQLRKKIFELTANFILYPRISDRAKKKITDELALLQKQKDDLHAQAESIRPTTMAYEDRAIMNQARAEELKRLQGVEDATELIGQYRIAQKNGETFKMEAILTKLTKNFDLNEILSSFNYDQNYKGLQDLIRDHFGTSQSDMEFGNDLTMMNKVQAAFRMGGAYIRDADGKLREAKESEHQQITLVESGKQDRETLWRRGFWGWMVGKKEDPNTGKRISNFDDTSGALIVRDLDMILGEIKKGRLSPELEADMSHHDFMSQLSQHFKKSSLSSNQQTQAQELLNHLATVQAKYW